MIKVVMYGQLYPVGCGTVGPHSDTFWPLLLVFHFDCTFWTKAAND